jgi:hypothetical protein
MDGKLFAGLADLEVLHIQPDQDKLLDWAVSWWSREETSLAESLRLGSKAQEKTSAVSEHRSTKDPVKDGLLCATCIYAYLLGILGCGSIRRLEAKVSSQTTHAVGWHLVYFVYVGS